MVDAKGSTADKEDSSFPAERRRKVRNGSTAGRRSTLACERTSCVDVGDNSSSISVILLSVDEAAR